MHDFRFNPRGSAPIVTAVIKGPRRTRKVRLIFDTGAEMTQFHSATMLEIGYSPSDAIAKASVVGIGGVESEGYIVTLQKLIVLGSEAEAFNVGVFEMQHLKTRRLDGLVGWDVIRAFHLRYGWSERAFESFLRLQHPISGGVSKVAVLRRSTNNRRSQGSHNIP